MTNLQLLREFLIESRVSWRETPRQARDGLGKWVDVPGTSVIIEQRPYLGVEDTGEPCGLMPKYGDPVEKVGGYGGFYTQADFDEAGVLITIGAWE